MLKKLRRKLTLLLSAITGAVLAAVLILVMVMNMRQRVAENEKWFSSSALQVRSYVEMLAAGVGENPQLDAEPYLVDIRVDGEPLLLAGGWDTASNRERLFAQARHQEEAAMGGLVPAVVESSISFQTGITAPAITVAGQSAIFEEKPLYLAGAKGDKYRAAFYSLPQLVVYDALTGLWLTDQYQVQQVLALEDTSGRFTVGMRTYEALVLENLDAQNRELALLAGGYMALLALGLALLVFANRLLAKAVLRPTEEGMRRQRDFVAAASHELRSPLAVVRSSLSAAEADEAQAPRCLKTAQAEAERMSRLVDDLLLLAGGDADSWRIQREEVDMDTLLLDTFEHWEPMAKDKGVALTLDLPEKTLAPLMADSDRLRQILGILLDNALQYAPRGTAVTLGAREVKPNAALWPSAAAWRMELFVADRGPGVPAQEKEKVFERFYRVDKAGGDKQHFGLGLSVASERAAAQGARLTLEDTPGGGATFRLAIGRQ